MPERESVPERESIEPPGGFTPKPRPDDLSAPELKPDWLVGADDGIDFGSARDEPKRRPTLWRPGVGPTDPAQPPPPPPRRPVMPPAAEPPAEPVAEAWAPAASSVPKLSVVPKRQHAFREAAIGEDLEGMNRLLGEDGEAQAGESDGGAEASAPAPPEEPWWLVTIETLASSRLIQIGLAVLAVVLFAWTFWPRKENQTISIASIKHHPERFEGQPVRIRGEVGEVFDVGSGVVFLLHQRRDTLVVFSPNRRPALHDRLLVQGTVSTGYLDGTPRVALFETPGAPGR